MKGISLKAPSGRTPNPNPKVPPRDFGTPLSGARNPCLPGRGSRWHTTHSRRQLLANAAIASSRVAAQPCVGNAVLMMPKASVHSRRSYRSRCRLHDAADHDAIGEHIVVVVLSVVAPDWGASSFTGHLGPARTAGPLLFGGGGGTRRGLDVAKNQWASAPTCSSFPAHSCTPKVGTSIDSAMESCGLSRRRLRVRAPSRR